MAPQAKKKPKAKPERASSANLDLAPDAWPKFEALVKSAAKMGHKPHERNAPISKRPKS